MSAALHAAELQRTMHLATASVKDTNGIIWSAVKLALKSRNLDIAQWQTDLANALHSVR